MDEHLVAQGAARPDGGGDAASLPAAADGHLDGNAAGGLLRELFAFDVTAADATCAGCGGVGPVGALMAYGHRMGVVLRCPRCLSSVLRVTRTTRGYWLDLSGARMLRVPAGDAGAAPPPA